MLARMALEKIFGEDYMDPSAFVVEVSRHQDGSCGEDGDGKDGEGSDGGDGGEEEGEMFASGYSWEV